MSNPRAIIFFPFRLSLFSDNSPAAYSAAKFASLSFLRWNFRHERGCEAKGWHRSSNVFKQVFKVRVQSSAFGPLHGHDRFFDARVEVKRRRQQEELEVAQLCSGKSSQVPGQVLFIGGRTESLGWNLGSGSKEALQVENLVFFQRAKQFAQSEQFVGGGIRSVCRETRACNAQGGFSQTLRNFGEDGQRIGFRKRGLMVWHASNPIIAAEWQYERKLKDEAVIGVFLSLPRGCSWIKKKA